MNNFRIERNSAGPESVFGQVAKLKSEILAELDRRGVIQDYMTAREQIATFADTLRKKHPQLSQRVKAWHALIESNIPPDYASLVDLDDFPEREDNVLDFLKRVRAEVFKENL